MPNTKNIPSIYGPTANNANEPARPPVVGADGRKWCPACRGSLHRTRTPARCPECLQKIEVSK